MTPWRKSSYSDSPTGNCIEVAFDTATWRKSSYSHDVGSDCVEVAFESAAWVRDSKNVQGLMLTFEARAWREFVGSLHA